MNVMSACRMAGVLKTMTEGSVKHIPVVKDDGSLDCELTLNDFLSFLHF